MISVKFDASGLERKLKRLDEIQQRVVREVEILVRLGSIKKENAAAEIKRRYEREVSRL